MTAPVCDEFQGYRALLFGIAYRMTGSVSDAEDIVQEAYLRSYTTPAHDIRSPKAFLSTIVTRLCLDHLKSARLAREQYIGPWLPEPLLTTNAALTPLDSVELRETIDVAFLVLMETLTPLERAVFLLREVFEYPYDEIAGIVGKSVANCRQLFHRANDRLAERKARFRPASEDQQRLIVQFLQAVEYGDVVALEQLLAHDVVSWSDGGGKVTAGRRPVVGHAAVLRLILGIVRKAPAQTRVMIEEVNGGPAVLVWVAETLFTVLHFEMGPGTIKGLRFILNPAKLTYLQNQIASRS